METIIVKRGGLGGASGANLTSVATGIDSNEAKTQEKIVPEITRLAVPLLEASKQRFRAMTFNLRFDTQRDGPNRWCFRKHLASATVRRHGADIIGFQETLPHQIKDLEVSLPEFEWTGVGRDNGKDEGEFCPVFWRKDKFKSVDSGTFWLSETPNVAGSTGWGAQCRRIATWVRLVSLEVEEGTQAPREVFFLNSHFDHASNQARLESARLLSHTIPKLIAESNQRLSSTVFPSVVVVGDLNAQEDTQTLRLLRGEERLHQDEDLTNAIFFKDARLEAKLKYNERDGSFTDWSPATPSEEAKRLILIDHLLHHGDLEPEQYGIICELWQGRRASDHRPLITDYRFLSTATSR